MPRFLRNNKQIIKDASTITTSTVTSGLLNPEQSDKFLQQVYEATPLQGLVRHETRRSQTGEIDKIGIASRILRKKVENTDDGYRAAPTYDKLEYAVKAVRLPWEITEETLRQNIEGQNYERIVTDLMTGQVGRDMEDLELNGDESISADDKDHDFLYIDNGWIKQASAGGHVNDRSTKDSGAMSLDVFYDTLGQMPNKYNNGKLRWIMSPHRAQEWTRYLLTQAVTNGGIITDGRVESPASVPVVQAPAMPDDKILLTDPKNLIVVNTYNIIIRKTTEGKEAIMQDKRFYTIHLDFDTLIEELDAIAIITGLAAI